MSARSGSASERTKRSSVAENNPMPTALPRPITAATGETRRGTRAWREKAGRWKSRMEADGQGKARKVIAGLREPQTRCVTITMTKTATASCRMRTGDRPPPATTTGAEGGVRALSHAGHPASLGQGRTGHLHAPYLPDCVNTGSPNLHNSREMCGRNQAIDIVRNYANGLFDEVFCNEISGPVIWWLGPISGGPMN